ncbi:MAG: peptide deformylase [Chloroflexales bacterium]|nr:peptide deformylase [Chloroflexales bacterium]
MAVRRILRIDDPEDKKILKGKAREVRLPPSGLKQLVTDMFETMRAANGVGLAAPQIGLGQRLIVIETPAVVEKLDDGSEVEVEPSATYTLINPEIVKVGKDEIDWTEGCLSIPGWYGEVPRPSWVTVEYSDLDGRRKRLRHADGWLGRILQHEIDHLDGVLFTERMRDLSTLHELKPEDAPDERQQATERDDAPWSAS